jgi:hypothetical protein
MAVEGSDLPEADASAVTPEQRRKRLEDPVVKARIQEVLAELRRSDPSRRGIGKEELPDFLREHG